MKMKQCCVLLFLCLCLTTFTQAQTKPQTDTIKTDDAQIFQNMLITNMDNMLDLWYVKREIANSRSVLSKLKDDPNAVEANDSIMIDRLNKISTTIRLGYNETVKRNIELYVDKRKRSSSALLGLAQYYFPWMQEIFDKYGVPEELIYLTIIESSLNPYAVSRAGATGIWQFMYTTGKMYGLEVNTFIDDRRDPYKATDAAARHLRDLYNIFDDWGLAISAYNCGSGNVRKAISRAGGGKHDFWSLSKYLPRETQNYFPAFIGALYMMKYHNLYGITPAKIAIPSAVDTVMITKELHLEQVAQALQLEMNEVKILNPQYKRDVIPAYSQSYPLRLKSPDIMRYIEMKDSIHNYMYDNFFIPIKVYENMFTGKTDPNVKTQNVYHYVKKGETLSTIANKYNLSVYELKKMNRLSSNSIQVKQRLLVGYKSVATPASTPKPEVEKEPAQNESQVKTDTVVKSEQSAENQPVAPDYYVVKKGDTFYGIAQKLNTTPKRLAEYNDIKNMNVLSVGQRLKIPQNN